MPKRALAAIALIVLVAAVAAAQRGPRGGFSRRPLAYATVEDFDGSFQFCRVVFRRALNGDGGDWSVDFPRADENLSIRCPSACQSSPRRPSALMPTPFRSTCSSAFGNRVRSLTALSS